ncbi:MAG TPA: N-acetyl-gamma-glutamyl-phosphate reductase [Gammaproteobacteria bacterium]|jgi:N-acetyl-gamma-glutamyl-phosphate reductase
MSGSWPCVILGGTGYVAGEMLRLVLGHPNLSLAASVSTSQAGTLIREVFPHLGPAVAGTRFASYDDALGSIESATHSVLLSAAPHGQSAEIIGQALDRAAQAGVELTVVDASADFRFADPEAFASVYGKPHPRPELLAGFTCAVPEHAKSVDSGHAAQPGCFATSMLLGIVPLVTAGLCEPRFSVSAVTGSTGAGRKPRDTTHHPERQSNLFAYQPLTHRHEPEVEALVHAATGSEIALDFVPHSGPFARGIHATLFARLSRSAVTDDVMSVLDNFYAESPLVHVEADLPRVKNVAGSCHASLGCRVEGDTIVVCSSIDNLLKGAAGGCLQWVNRLLGLPETTGLDAPAPGWI